MEYVSWRSREAESYAELGLYVLGQVEGNLSCEGTYAVVETKKAIMFENMYKSSDHSLRGVWSSRLQTNL